MQLESRIKKLETKIHVKDEIRIKVQHYENNRWLISKAIFEANKALGLLDHQTDKIYVSASEKDFCSDMSIGTAKRVYDITKDFPEDIHSYLHSLDDVEINNLYSSLFNKGLTFKRDQPRIPLY